MKFLNHIDLDQNQVLNVVLHKSATAPTSPVDGQVYFNTTSSLYFYYKASDTTWVQFGAGTLTADNLTLEINAGVVRIKDLGVTTGKIADAAVTTIKITDKNITFAKIQDVPTMTVIGRVAAGSGVTSAITIIDAADFTGATSTNLATAGSIKAYVDSRISSLGTLVGAFNTTTSTTFPGGSGVFKGNYWYVTVAGTVQGVTLNIGDVLIANKDTPSTTVAADWIFLESNRDQATTTVLGVVMLATNAESQTGSDPNKVLTPATLSARTATTARTGILALATSAEGIAGIEATKAITSAVLKSVLDTTVLGLSYSTNVGDGTALTFTLTHNFGTKDVAVEIYDSSTGATVYVDVTRPTVNTCVLSFAKAPALNAYRLKVNK